MTPFETDHDKVEKLTLCTRSKWSSASWGKPRNFWRWTSPPDCSCIRPNRAAHAPLWDGLRELLGYEIATGGQVSLINRLDRETSGIVLVAKTAAAARAAGLAMQGGAFHKEYLALVFGWPDWEELVVDAPILRLGEVAESPVSGCSAPCIRTARWPAPVFGSNLATGPVTAGFPWCGRGR